MSRPLGWSVPEPVDVRGKMVLSANQERGLISMRFNLCLATDSYKVVHGKLYPPRMTNLYSYLEPRGGAYQDVVFFGLQYYLQAYLAGQVFTLQDIEEARLFWSQHFGRDDCFATAAWIRLFEQHQGRLPLRIRAVPEGMIVPIGNVLMTIESTDPEFAWLVGWIETLVMKVWYPITVATQSLSIRKTIGTYYTLAGANLANLDVACHDFGYRGVSSEESAGLGAAAHLLSFNGTDTPAGIRLLADHYNGAMSGHSIPATEHSVICAFGPEGEQAAYEHLLKTFPHGTIACVSDTYDIYNAVGTIWGQHLREEVQSRTGGPLVIRPDSGDPLDVVPNVLTILDRRFGSREVNGFKVLNDAVRVIQGDGMNPGTIALLYDKITTLGWSPVNLTIGSGGALLQKVDRDTLGLAIKASEVTVDGVVRAISKDPVTARSKRSRSGRLKLAIGLNHELQTVSNATEPHQYSLSEDLMNTVFENGEVAVRHTLEEVRSRLRSAAG